MDNRSSIIEPRCNISLSIFFSILVPPTTTTCLIRVHIVIRSCTLFLFDRESYFRSAGQGQYSMRTRLPNTKGIWPIYICIYYILWVYLYINPYTNQLYVYYCSFFFFFSIFFFFINLSSLSCTNPRHFCFFFNSEHVFRNFF